jgi:hypothetical protein
MATKSDDWTVLPHEPIVRLAENLWWARGSLPRISLRRVMTIARLADGRLVIHNGIALEEAAMREIEDWGTPAFLIVPNGFHRQDAAAYRRRYPNVRVLAPRGSRGKIAQVVAVDGIVADFPADDAVRFEPIDGVADAEVAMLVRSADGTTLVLTDVMFNMDRKRDVLGYLFTTVLGSAPGPRVSRLAKWLLVKDAPAVRRDFERWADLPDLKRLIVAHEKIATGPDARAALRAAATYL